MHKKRKKKARVPTRRLVQPLQLKDGCVGIGQRLHLVMFGLEKGLIAAGARPGRDYTFSTLFVQAVPLVQKWMVFPEEESD